MYDSRKEKDKQLGIPFGTANGRLRKSIMFALVQECGKDTCYRCGKKIELEKDFTIDHKEDWLHSDDPAGLFFDLGNISFSHRKCNYKHSRIFKGNGVYFDQQYQMWKSKITRNGKHFFIGRFNDKEKAKRHYRIAVALFKEKKISSTQELQELIKAKIGVMV